MKAMWIIFSVLVSLVLILWLAGLKLTLNPFSISFEKWLDVTGWLLIAIGVMCIKQDSWNRGFKKSMDGIEQYVDEHCGPPKEV